MANRPAPELVLREGDLEVLESWLRATTVPAGLARRARIVLLAAQGMANSRIAQAVGVSIPTVVSWRRRYQAGVCGGWGTRPARGVPGRCLGSGSWPLPWRRLPRGTGSRTGGAGCWPPTWASATPPWRGCGAAMGSSPGGRGPSSTPPTPSWWAGSPTWWACTWRPRTTPWCCASTRSPRSRPWTAPPRCCPCSRAGSSGAPTTPLRRWHAHPPRRVRSRLGLRHQPRSPGTVITGHHWSQINRPPQNPSLDVPVCFNWGGFGQESTGTPTGIRTQDHVLIRHARGISSLL